MRFLRACVTPGPAFRCSDLTGVQFSALLEESWKFCFTHVGRTSLARSKHNATFQKFGVNYVTGTATAPHSSSYQSLTVVRCPNVKNKR